MGRKGLKCVFYKHIPFQRGQIFVTSLKEEVVINADQVLRFMQKGEGRLSPKE